MGMDGSGGVKGVEYVQVKMEMMEVEWRMSRGGCGYGNGEEKWWR